MSAEENKATVRRVIEEIVNKGNLEVADEVFASDYVYHSLMEDIKGPEGFKEFVRMMHTAFQTYMLPLKILLLRVTKWRVVLSCRVHSKVR